AVCMARDIKDDLDAMPREALDARSKLRDQLVKVTNMSLSTARALRITMQSREDKRQASAAVVKAAPPPPPQTEPPKEWNGIAWQPHYLREGDRGFSRGVPIPHTPWRIPKPMESV